MSEVKAHKLSDVTGSVPTVNMSNYTHKSNFTESYLLYTVDMDAELKIEGRSGPNEHTGVGGINCDQLKKFLVFRKRISTTVVPALWIHLS